MADKVVSGIGREIRYFEYKFRKNQRNKKKKDKNGNLTQQDLAWSDSTTGSSLQSTSDEFRKAAPGSTGEEALQIQVAMAMSREEEQERDRQSESDKLRLEMALKESMQLAETAKQTQEVKNQPSLLDLSLSAPKPAAAGPNPFNEQPATSTVADPWASSTPSSVTFDPFANQKPVNQANIKPPMPLQSNDFGADSWGMPAPSQHVVPQQASAPVVSQNPWGAPTPQAVANVPSADPWSVGPSQTAPSAPVADPWGSAVQSAPVVVSTQNNAWAGAPQPVVPQPSASQAGAWSLMDNPSSNVPLKQQNGAWPSPTSVPANVPANGAWGKPNPDPFLSLSQRQDPPKSSYDPFYGNASSGPLAPSTNGFLTSSAPAHSPSGNPFGAQSGDIFAAPPFDPLKDFDNLHIGSNEPEPVVLTHDFTPGASVSKDLFPMNISANPIPQNNDVAPVTHATTNSNPHQTFLGANSSLVNLDSGWKYSMPYNAKPLGGTTQNPFQQTGPTRTLNEMMAKQPGFK